jgi:hypothetical protein
VRLLPRALASRERKPPVFPRKPQRVREQLRDRWLFLPTPNNLLRSLQSLTAAPYPLVPGRERRASHRVLVAKNEPALRLSKPKVSVRQRVRQIWVGFACRADWSATPAPVIDHAVLLWQLRSLLRPCDRLPSPIRACPVYSRPVMGGRGRRPQRPARVGGRQRPPSMLMVKEVR